MEKKNNKGIILLVIVCAIATVVAGVKALGSFDSNKESSVDVIEVTPSASATTEVTDGEIEATTNSETEIIRNEPTEVGDDNPNLDPEVTVDPGSAGLLSMKKDQVLALNWSEDGTNNGTTGATVEVYKTESGMLVIKPLFVWNSEVGEMMELTDEAGIVTTYECVETHNVLVGATSYVFSDDMTTEAESANLGQVVIISNGQASYWNAQ